MRRGDGPLPSRSPRLPPDQAGHFREHALSLRRAATTSENFAVTTMHLVALRLLPLASALLLLGRPHDVSRRRTRRPIRLGRRPPPRPGRRAAGCAFGARTSMRRIHGGRGRGRGRVHGGRDRGRGCGGGGRGRGCVRGRQGRGRRLRPRRTR